MIHKRTAGLLAALMLGALLMAGCGGDGGQTVDAGVHDLLQQEYDAALADLRVERQATVRERAARTAAEGEAMRLRGELETASGKVTALEARIGAEADDASASATASLYAQLNHAKAEEMRLEGVIGDETDTASASATASLYAQLNAAKNQVTTLMAQIGAATDMANASTTASLNAQLNAAKVEVTRLTGVIGSATDTANAATTASLHAQLRAAKAEATRLEGVIGDATTPAATSLRGQLAAEKTKVADLQRRLGIATTAQEEAETARDAAQQQAAQQQAQAAQLQEQLTEAQQAELTARASAFHTELVTPGAGTADVTWPRDGSLTFRPTGTLTPGTSAPSVPGGWRRASFTGQTGTAAALIDQTAYLYTNIQTPGTRAFWKVYGFSRITLGEADTPVALARGSRGQAVTETPDADTTNVTEIRVSGSFNSAPGTFTCATACASSDLGGGSRATSAAINAHVADHVTFERGRPIFDTAASWTFKPNSITSGVPLQQDEAYLYFGIWSSIPVSLAAETTDFRYIVGGGAESGTDLTGLSALTGSATFKGGAVGRYVTLARVGENAKIGTFTATATLNANFGDATADGTLSGSITDFREGGSTLAGWRVTLGSTTDVGTPVTVTDGAVASTAGGTVANIGGLAVGGSWAATFYGSDNVRTGATAEQTIAKYPPADLAGVVGWFNAGTATSNASLAGAFGAVCTGAMCAK